MAYPKAAPLFHRTGAFAANARDPVSHVPGALSHGMSWWFIGCPKMGKVW